MTAHRRPVPRGHRRAARSHRLFPVALGLTLLGVGGVVGPSVVDNVAGDGGAEQRRLTLSALPSDAPDQGLVYDGLEPARAGTLCAGSYAVDDTTCTHGPSLAPAGLSVRHDVTPVAARAPEPVAPAQDTLAVPPDAEIARDQGGSALTADAPALIPDAAPGDADFIMGAHDVACQGDGRSGKRVQVLYLHEFGTPSRFTDFVGSVRIWAAGADQIFDASAAETGGSRHVRFVTTPQCQVDVAEVQVPTTSLKTFTGTMTALQKLGYNRTDRKYLMFADTNVYCGIATYVADRRTGLGNRNNGGPSYGRIDAGCWSSVMAARELTETLGAVLIDSPNSSGAGSCLDDYDLLCGKDRSGRPVRPVCPRKHENRLDCNHDDYFSTSPKAGSYLARNWNIAQSEFLLRSDGGNDIPDSGVALPPAPATPTPAATRPSPAVISAAPTPSAEVTPSAETPAAVPSTEVTPTAGGEPTAGPAEPTATPETPAAVVTEPAAATGAARVVPVATKATTRPPVDDLAAPDPVQAVLEVRDATSGSVRLTWSAAAPTATYEVSVDGAPIATTQATRARLIGLKPDAKYTVVVRSGKTYAARAAAETAPAARPAQNSWFLLANALTGGAADLYAARTAIGTPLTLSAGADGDAQQQWQLVPAGGGSYSLVSRATGKCAVPLGGNPVAGAPLVQGECAGDNGGRWSLQASDYGFTLRTTDGGLAVGVGNQRFGAQRVLTLQQANGQRHQSWTAVPD